MATKVKRGQLDNTVAKRANVGSAQCSYFNPSTGRQVMRDGVDSDCLAIHFTLPEDYVAGTDVALKLVLRADAALGATNIIVSEQISYWNTTGGEQSITSNGGLTVAIAASAGASLVSFTIPAASCLSGRAYWLRFLRLGTNGSDNCTAEVSFLGAWIEYTGYA